MMVIPYRAKTFPSVSMFKLFLHTLLLLLFDIQANWEQKGCDRG